MQTEIIRLLDSNEMTPRQRGSRAAAGGPLIVRSRAWKAV